MKINIIYEKGRRKPKCTECGHVFDTDTAQNPYEELCRIALGRTFRFCPICGSPYEGCQVEGIDLKDCGKSTKDWLYRGI